MTSLELSRKALELFEKLVDADAEERRRRLEEVHAEEPSLAAAVRDLLTADAEDGLDSPWELAGTPASGPGVGDRFGPFELVRLLGEGGMGTVWEAHRVEGGFEQRVAIKFLRYFALGSVAERRFLLEREVLGKLQHPAIASILDAGRTESGAPYLVMEYVDGRRIDDHCDEQGLGVRERVRLVVEICRVVAHAHASLVIHRDLKPANVLVTEEGEPRLLDFGIAKLLEDGDERRDFTVEGLGPMTPDYASPEQIRGLPVTTASDVYSLGAVLYELLTGRAPFRRPTTSALELERSVLEGETTPPSRSLEDPGEAELEEPRRALLEARGVSSLPHLRRELRGDLDNITLQALRRDPERRYRSMEALAADLERWLGGYPVQARPDSLGYRTSKYLRRNWLPVVAAGLIFASLAAGFSVATWQAREARQQRDRADDNARRTEQVNRFLVDLLAAPGGRWWRDLKNKGPETRVIDVIDEAAARLEVDLDEAPLQRATLHQTLNDTYLALGLLDRAEHQVLRALEIRLHELGDVHPAVAESTYYLGATLRAQGRQEEALEVYRRAIEIERQLPEPTANLLQALAEVAATASRLGLHSEAEGRLQEVLAEVRRARSSATTGGYQLALRALLLADAGELGRAEAGLREAERWFAVAGEGPFQALGHKLQAAQTAVAWLDGDLEMALERSADPASRSVARLRAQVLYDLGRFDEALTLLGAPEVAAANVLEDRVLLARLEWVVNDDPVRCLELAEPALAIEEGWSRGPTWYLAEARSATAACLLARGRGDDLARSRELAAAARATLDELFDRPTPLHRRLPATTTPH